MNQEKKNKHLTLDDRIEIQECISKGMTLKIALTKMKKLMSVYLTPAQMGLRKHAIMTS